MKKKLLASLLALCMVFSLSLPAMAAGFDDTNGHWGQAAIDRWADYGVLNGDGTGSFQPDKQMTRAEFAQMLCNLMGYTKKASNSFTDVPADAWYADAILKLVGAGILNGVGDNKAAPNDPITREQSAVLLCRALNIKPSAGASIGFADAGSVSSWAKDAVAALTERGMINGVGNNTFAPLQDINRASVSQMVSNMVSEYVTENGATVTGEVKGIVIVKASNVKIENATLSEPVIVAPAAANATVSLTGATSAENVVVAAEGAKVVVAETASAKAVEVEAPKAVAEIAGKVDSVAVAETASDAAVSVGKTAEVKELSVDAPKAGVTVAGKVDSVDVADTAKGADIKTQTGAKVGTVTAAADATVSGPAGTVDKVTATGSSDVKVTVPNAEVKNEGTGNVTAGDKPVEPGKEETVKPSTPSGGGYTPAPTPVKKNNSVTKAIFHDTRKDAQGAATGTYVDDDTLKDGYSVDTSVVNGVTEVTINHQNIWEHKNAATAATLGYWTGYAIKAPEGALKMKYAFSNTKGDTTISSAEADLETIATGSDGTAIKGIAAYYNAGSETSTNKAYLGVQWKTSESGDDAWTNVTWYHASFNVSCKPAVENATAYVVNTVKNIKDLELPEDSLNALLTKDWQEKDGNAALPEAPWLVVVYDRNVAGNVTLTVTKAGQTLSGADTATSNTTIGTKRVQAWAMTPATDTASMKLWSDSTNATFSGNYSVSFSYDSKTATATPVEYKHTGETVYDVTFTVPAGVTAPQKQVVKSGQKATEPAAPTKANSYFVGWYKGDTAFDFESTNITEATTIEAKFVEITPVTVTTRPAGPAKGAADTASEGDFNYEENYGKAGMTYANNTITVNVPKAAAYVAGASQENATTKNDLAYMSIKQGTPEKTYLMYGVAFPKPTVADGAEIANAYFIKKDEALTIPAAGTWTTSATGYENANLGTDDLQSYDGSFVDYIAAGSYDSTTGAVTFNDDITRNYIVVYTDSEGNVLAIQTATIERKMVTEGDGVTELTAEPYDFSCWSNIQYMTFTLKNGSNPFYLTNDTVKVTTTGEGESATYNTSYLEKVEGTWKKKTVQIESSTIQNNDTIDTIHQWGWTLVRGEQAAEKEFIFTKADGSLVYVKIKVPAAIENTENKTWVDTKIEIGVDGTAIPSSANASTTPAA